jgi:hypothetical protein
MMAGFSFSKGESGPLRMESHVAGFRYGGWLKFSGYFLPRGRKIWTLSTKNFRVGPPYPCM